MADVERFHLARESLGAGIAFASHEALPETSKQLVYDEPTVMWRMRRVGGQLSHAVIAPRADGAVVVWFLNDLPIGSRDFPDWSAALRWSEQLQFQNWAVGWRHV